MERISRLVEDIVFNYISLGVFIGPSSSVSVSFHGFLYVCVQIFLFL